MKVLTIEDVRWIVRLEEHKVYIDLSTIPGRGVGVAAIRQLHNGMGWVQILVIRGKRYNGDRPLSKRFAKQRLIDIIIMESIGEWEPAPDDDDVK